MRHPITGQYEPNITCPKCRHRHPATWSCKLALDVSTHAAEERQQAREQDHDYDPEIPVTRSLLVAAIAKLRELDGDDQVVLNLQAIVDGGA